MEAPTMPGASGSTLDTRKAPTHDAEMPRICAEQKTTIDDMLMLISRLADRLEPVLSTMDVPPDRPSEAVLRQQPVTPLGATLDQYTYSLQTGVVALRLLLDRIEV